MIFIIEAPDNPEKIYEFIDGYDFPEEPNKLWILTKNNDNKTATHFNKIRLKYKKKIEVLFVINPEAVSREEAIKNLNVAEHRYVTL